MRVGGLNKCVLGYERGLFEEGGIVLESKGIDGDLGYGGCEDGVYGGDVLGGGGVGDGDDEDMVVKID